MMILSGLPITTITPGIEIESFQCFQDHDQMGMHNGGGPHSRAA